MNAQLVGGKRQRIMWKLLWGGLVWGRFFFNELKTNQQTLAVHKLTETKSSTFHAWTGCSHAELQTACWNSKLNQLMRLSKQSWSQESTRFLINSNKFSSHIKGKSSFGGCSPWRFTSTCSVLTSGQKPRVMLEY